MFEPGEGWTKIDGVGPSTRGRQAVAYDANIKRMLIFGGRYRKSGTTGAYTLFNDVWAFDFSSRTWEQLSDGKEGPSERYFSTAAYDNATDTFYVYGGDTNPSALGITLANDVWSYKEGKWSEMIVTGKAPSPNRLFVAYTHDSKRNALIVYGGQIGDFVTAGNKDLYSLDLNIGVWTKLDDGSNGPDGRFSAMMSYDSKKDQYVMMGGHGDAAYSNDIWTYDPNGGGWEKQYQGDVLTGAPLGCLGNSQELPKNYLQEDLNAPQGRSGGFFGFSGQSLVVWW